LREYLLGKIGAIVYSFTGEWDVWSTDTFGSSGMPESDRERRGHRIRVSQKKSDDAALIQQIQLLALKQGKTVPFLFVPPAVPFT